MMPLLSGPMIFSGDVCCLLWGVLLGAATGGVLPTTGVYSAYFGGEGGLLPTRWVVCHPPAVDIQKGVKSLPSLNFVGGR